MRVVREAEDRPKNGSAGASPSRASLSRNLAIPSFALPSRVWLDEASGRRGVRLSDVHFAALEFYVAVFEREDGVIAAYADIEAGVELRSALTDDDGAGGDELPAVGFDASVLRVAVATVLG